MGIKVHTDRKKNVSRQKRFLETRDFFRKLNAPRKLQGITGILHYAMGALKLHAKANKKC